MSSTPIKDLIDEWKPRRALAEEIGAPVASVHKWAENDRIPSRWQARVVQAAQDRGLRYVTGDWMLAAHEDLRAAS